jgi:hypothetical protein
MSLPDSIYETTDELSRPCTACHKEIPADTLFYMHVSDTAGFCTEKCVADSKEGLANLDEMLADLEDAEVV